MNKKLLTSLMMVSLLTSCSVQFGSPVDNLSTSYISQSSEISSSNLENSSQDSNSSNEESSSKHEHTYSTEWSNNETHHWYAATCEHTDLKFEKTKHTWDTGKLIKSSTCNDTGEMLYTCTICGYEAVTDSESLGHFYGEPTYVWSSDYSTVTATRVCAHDDKHFEKEVANTTVTIVQDQTCTKEELTTFTATFTNEAFETQVKEKVKTKDALTHSYGEPTYVWSDDYSTVTATRVCSHDDKHIETETANTSAEITQKASHTLDELTTYTAIFENPMFDSQTKSGIITRESFADCVYGDFVKTETEHYRQCLYCDSKTEQGTHSCTSKASWEQGKTCDVCEHAMKAENALLAHYTFENEIKNYGVDTNVKGTGVTNDGNFTEVDMITDGKVVSADGTSNLTMKVAHHSQRTSFRLSNIDTGTGDFTISAKIYQSGTIGKKYDETKAEGWEFQHYLMGTADANERHTNVSKPFFNIRLAQVKSAVMKLQVIVNGEIKVLDGYITSKSWVEYRVVKEGNTVTVSTHFTYTGTNNTIKPSSVTYELESPEDLKLDPSYFLGFGYNYGTTAPGNDSFVDDIKVWNYAVDFAA